MKILVPHSLLRRRFHKDSRYPKDNSTVSVCIAANCVLQKRPRVAHSCSHCHELLADKKHTRAHNGTCPTHCQEYCPRRSSMRRIYQEVKGDQTFSRSAMYRSDERIALMVPSAENTRSLTRQEIHVESPMCVNGSPIRHRHAKN